MTTQLQQALTITQAAVGQLQGMFKRLAQKMEADVTTLKTGLQEVARTTQQQRNEIAALRNELARIVQQPRTDGSRPVAPAQRQPEPGAVQQWPEAASRRAPEVEDAVFYAGGEDDED